MCMRAKAWRCRDRVTLARLPWRAHVACVPRLRQRQSFSRMHALCPGHAIKISTRVLWGYLSFHPTAQCVVRARKGVACHVCGCASPLRARTRSALYISTESTPPQYCLCGSISCVCRMSTRARKLFMRQAARTMCWYELCSLGVLKLLVVGYCDNCVREKDWRCRKRGTQAM